MEALVCHYDTEVAIVEADEVGGVVLFQQSDGFAAQGFADENEPARFPSRPPTKSWPWVAGRGSGPAR